MLYKNVLFVAFAALAAASPIRRDLAADAESLIGQAVSAVPGLAEELGGLGGELGGLAGALGQSDDENTDMTDDMDMDMSDMDMSDMNMNMTTTADLALPTGTAASVIDLPAGDIPPGAAAAGTPDDSSDDSTDDDDSTDATDDETPDASELGVPTGAAANDVDLPAGDIAPGAAIAGSRRDVNPSQVQADDSPAPVASVAAAPKSGPDAAKIDLPAGDISPASIQLNNAVGARDVNPSQVQADDSPAPVSSVAAAPKTGPDASKIDLPAGDIPPASIQLNNAVGARDVNPSQVQADDSPAPVASVAAAPKTGPDASKIDLPAGDIPPASIQLNNAVGARDVNPSQVQADDSPAPVASVAAAPKTGPDAAKIDLPAGDISPASIQLNNAVGARDVNPTQVQADDSPAPVSSVAAAPKTGPDAAKIDLPAGDIPPASIQLNNAVGARDVNPSQVQADDSPAPVASVAAAPKTGPDAAKIDLPAGDISPASIQINNAVGA